MPSIRVNAILNRTKSRRADVRLRLLTLLVSTLFVTPRSEAQFQSRVLDLPIVADTIIAAELTQDEWIDYWVYGTGAEGQRGYWIYENQGNYTFALRSVSVPLLAEATFVLADLNLDNQLDVVVSGRSADDELLTQVHYNQYGTFSTLPQVVSRTQAHTLGCADFNQDGRMDIFLNGYTATDSVVANLYLNTDEGFLLQTPGIRAIATGQTLIYDWDNDGRVDVLQAGRAVDGGVVTQLYQNDGTFPYPSYEVGLPTLVATALATGDINHDRRPDLLLSGADTRGTPVTYLYEYRDPGYAPVEIDLSGVAGTLASLADYNHDGLTDVGLVGTSASGASLARWYQQLEDGWIAKDYDSLATAEAAWAVGDVDNDGHLDLLRGATDAAPARGLVNFTAGINAGPTAPVSPSVSVVDTITYFGWQPNGDDRTDPATLTYELYVLSADSARYALSPEYQDTTKARVDHGRVSRAAYHTLYGLPEDTYYWNVAAVDNAFQIGGECRGWGDGNEGGGGPLCFTIDRADTSVCVGTTLQLTAPGEVAWTSNRSGDVANGSELDYVVRGNDILYYTLLSDTSCALTYSLRIEALPSDSVELLAADTTACPGTSLTLAVDSTYTTVAWFSATQDTLATGRTLAWEATQADTLWVAAQIGAQCPLWDTLVVSLFPSVVLLSEATLSITRGTSVILVADGAQTYQWSPAAGLSRTDVANPEASPTETITYTVVGTTADGCTVSDTITVRVVSPPAAETATLFVPNLFSPNGDGQNDHFRLYGDNVGAISWRVYDRQGTQLFEASHLEKGWDGKYRGRDVPTGVYVWKIEGQYTDGTPLRFEDKQSGMLRLVR